MITSFHIKNFRSCRDVSLDGIGQILVLAGRNGAGKTNILRSIDWLAKMASTSWQFAAHVISSEERMEGAIAFDVGGIPFRYEAKSFIPRPTSETFSIEISETLHCAGQQILLRDGEHVRLAGNQEIRIGAVAPALPAALSLLPERAAHRAELQSALDFLAGIRYYPLDEPSQSPSTAVIKRDDYTDWLARHKVVPADKDSVPMRLLHLHLTSRDSFEELKEVIGDNGLSLISEIAVGSFSLPGNRGLSVDGSSTGHNDEYYYIKFVPSGSRDPISYQDLSLGTRRVLRIVSSVVFDRSSVMLLEQPEDSIHSGLTNKVVAFFRQNATTTQFILASHSANVFNEMQPDEIRFVAFRDGETVVRPLSEREVVVAERYVNEDGPLSEYLALVDTD